MPNFFIELEFELLLYTRGDHYSQRATYKSPNLKEAKPVLLSKSKRIIIIIEYVFINISGYKIYAKAK